MGFGTGAQARKASILEVNSRRKRRYWAYHFYLVRFRPWDPTKPRFWKTKQFLTMRSKIVRLDSRQRPGVVSQQRLRRALTWITLFATNLLHNARPASAVCQRTTGQSVNQYHRQFPKYIINSSCFDVSLHLKHMHTIPLPIMLLMRKLAGKHRLLSHSTTRGCTNIRFLRVQIGHKIRFCNQLYFWIGN